jgi:hypothetical protein
MTSAAQALQQFINSLPNPAGIKQFSLNIGWHQPIDQSHTAIFVVALLVLAIVVIAVAGAWVYRGKK